MSRNSHSAGKRQREADKARKKKDKAERLHRNRENAPEGTPIASVAEVQVAAMRTPIGDGSPGVEGIPRASGPPCRLFVGGLNWETTGEDLKKLFSTCGDVVSATVVTDRDTGESRGFGFVTMGDRKAGARAVADLDGKDLDGRALRVNVATERPR